MRIASLILACLFLVTSALAAADRPNIVLIMSDDMGFSDIGCYGSEIETPTLNGLAANGLRFTQFYNTGRCCPTRASLLTGLYPHQAGIGHMMGDYGAPGYRGDLNLSSVTIGEVMRTAGYRTYMAGKWHVTPSQPPDVEQDRHNWPLQRGFDRFYGTIHGAGSFFDPNTLTRDNTLISPYADPEYRPKQYYYTNAIADNAARFITEHQQQHADTPFFMYVAFTSAHWPMHALEEDIAKYKGRYDAGYAAVRDARYRKMVDLGLITKENTVNWPIPDDWKETEYLQWDIRNMEVYAAMIDCMDRGIGRIVQALRDTKRFDNTLVLFLQDNGGCAETYGRGGTGGPRADKPSFAPLPNDYIQPQMTPTQNRAGFPIRTGKGAMAGPDDTAIGYGKTWATVSNTPFREYKHYVHEGGISTPLIAHWPNGFQRRGELETTPGHLIDLMATCVDVADAKYPQTFHDGTSITPMEGRSLVSAFRGRGIERDALYWEHEGNRAIRVGDMKLVAKGATSPWELYNIAKDRSEQNNLVEEMPKLAEQMAEKWNAWAKRAWVLPLHGGRTKQKQTYNRQQLRFELKQGDTLPGSLSPYIEKRGISLSVKVKPKASQQDGVIVAQGGSSKGWALYLENGRAMLGTTLQGKHQRIAGGKVNGETQVAAEITADGKASLTVNGETVSGNIAPLSQPQDGLDVGLDTKGCVGPYRAENNFAGTLSEVVINVVK